MVIKTAWLVSTACVSAAAMVGAAAAQNVVSDHPNVLFIAVDDLRPELGCYGATHVKSPHIDALANSGVAFTHAYCQQAVCNPSRASLLTGRRPDTLRVWDLHTDFRETMPDVVTLPQYFKQQGYHTVAIGKIFHNVIPDPASWSEDKLHIDGYPFDPDAVYRDSANVTWLEHHKQELQQAGQAEQHMDRIGQWYLKYTATECVDVPDDAYYDGAQTTVAIGKLKELQRTGTPFFFGVGYYRPHLPFNAPKRYWDMYERSRIPLAANPFVPRGAPIMAVNTTRELRGYADFRSAPRPDQGVLGEADARRLRHGYFACVSYIDAQVGRLLAAIDELGLRNNTIVVLWGDHGWKLGEHASWCKMTNYEIDTRVPLIVRAPGATANGQQCASLVEFVDIYPTLCELAQLPIPGEVEGKSFAPLFDAIDRPWKRAVYSQFLRDGIWVAPDGVDYMGYAVRTERFRFVQWENWKTGHFAARELYDLDQDPQENQNVIDRPQYAGDVKRLGRLLINDWPRRRPDAGPHAPR